MNLAYKIYTFLILILPGSAILYQFILAIASLFRNKRPFALNSKTKFLIAIPAYKEDEIILDSLKENLKVHYPKDYFDICVIAQHLQENTIKAIETTEANVIQLNIANSTKVKALKFMIAEMDLSNYEAIIILDADNIMSKKFLQLASHDFKSGKKVIQGIRKAKCDMGPFQAMDSLSEIANQNMLCKGANQLGFSARLSGSAMILEKEIFCSLIDSQSAIGGFDKEMEMELALRNVFIHFNKEAIVYDEKINDAGAYSKQRARWIQAQFNYFFKYLTYVHISRSADFYFKLFQLSLSPRAFLLPIMLMSVLLSAIKGNQYFLLVFTTLAFINIATYVLVIPGHLFINKGRNILQALPKFFIAAFNSLLYLKGARKSFLHTKHYKSN